MVLDEIDAAIFDVTQADAAAALVASWPVARAKINWSLTSPLYSAEMNAVIYSDAKRHDAEKDFWAERRIESRFIFEGTVPEKIREGVAARRAWGIPESAVVLATAGTNLEQTLGDEFVETVIEALKTNRQAICLIIGPGNFSAQKKRFAGAGVSGRVGYVAGTAEVLAICDIYLADSPDAQTEGMLQAMELGKPILVGKLGAQYSARLAKLMREPEQRRILGKTMRRQISEQFSIRRTAELIIELCNSLLGGDQKAPAPPVSETAPALAKVA
jgi:glycosyltransferase involved in cell wall biosynthesis